MAYSRRKTRRASSSRSASRPRRTTGVRKRSVSRRRGASHRNIRVVVQLVQPSGYAAAPNTLGKAAAQPLRARY